MTDYRPTDEAQLAEAVTTAIEAGEPLEVVGGGSKRQLGRPTQLPHRLDLGAFSGIRSYEPAELVLTAGAATPLAEIEAALAAAGQMLAFEPPDWTGLLGGVSLGVTKMPSPPFGAEREGPDAQRREGEVGVSPALHRDPPHPDPLPPEGRRGSAAGDVRPASSPTLGGILACNMAGPRRIRAGAARDHFLGFRGVSGRGDVFKAGGYVVKNVTGYDLSKLMAGSYGTLAALTEVTVKVLPRPEATATIVLRGLDDERARAAMTVALNSSHEVGGAAHLPAAVAEGGAAQTFLRLEGPVPSVEARAAALTAELAGFGAVDVLDDAASKACWLRIRDVAPLAPAVDTVIWRISLPPTAAPGIVATLRQALDGRWFYDWGGGLVWLAVDGAPDGGAAPIRAAVGGLGHATLMRAPASLRAAVPVFQALPPTLAALTARVKDGFDPRRVLNRGRMYAEL